VQEKETDEAAFEAVSEELAREREERKDENARAGARIGELEAALTRKTEDYADLEREAAGAMLHFV
jgi:hypothetical protein